MRATLLATVVIIVIAAASEARAYTPAPKGSLEDQSLQLALKLRNLRVDPAPTGKRVRKIHVVTLPVFVKRDGWLEFFNVFHWKTKEYIIEREVVMRPGKIWDPERIKETERRLRDPLFTSLVVTAPVVSPVAGTVDYLVVTRDVWSLRLNSNYNLQSDSANGTVLALLLLAPSENNVFGYRKQAALVFSMDLGKYLIGPTYIDKNLMGTRMRLSATASGIFNRKTDELEGSTSTTILTYPFWSLATKWSGSLSVAHFDGVIRAFQGLDLLRIPSPSAPPQDPNFGLPFEYRRRQVVAQTSASRSIGRTVIHRFSLGYRLARTRASVLDLFPSRDPRDIDAVLPRSEDVSRPFVAYSMFTPVYKRYRNIQTYDLAEDRRLGPTAEAQIGYGAEILGSDFEHVTLSATTGWVGDIRGDGFLSVGVGGFGRLQDGALIDRQLSMSAKLVLPRWFKLFRVAGRVSYAGRFKESQNRFFQLGGLSGLRGYEIGRFRGLKRVIGNLEARSKSWRVLFTRVGGVVFVDAGGAADRLADIGSNDQFGLPLWGVDIGFGLRSLFPQLGPQVYRFDLSFPLNGVSAGSPRFIAGFDQVF